MEVQHGAESFIDERHLLGAPVFMEPRPTSARKARQREAGSATSASYGHKEKHGPWTKLADGIWEAKIPRFVDNDEEYKPEFGVVRLNAATYCDFRKSPAEFLKRAQAFLTKKVKVVLEGCPAAKPTSEEKSSTGTWCLPICRAVTAACRAYAGWSPPNLESNAKK